MSLSKWLKKGMDPFFERYFSDKALLRGEFELEFSHPDGEVFATRSFDNIILQTGEDHVASLIGGQSTSAFNAVAIGTDGTAESVSDLGLKSEIASGGGSRVSAQISEGEHSNETVYENTWTFTTNFSIEEAGITNNVVQGDETAWLTRKTFAAVDVEADDQLAMNYKITVGVDRSA